MSWRTENPPMDGTVIVAIGRRTWSSDHGGGSIPFTATEIRWSFQSDCWVYDRNSLSVGSADDETVHVDHWMPMPGEEAAR